METEAIKKLVVEGVQRKSCLAWAYLNQIKNEKGVQLEFQNHRFLKDIFDDFSPVQAYRKASQIGFSTMMILKSLWAAKYRSYNIIYTLPTGGDVNNFVGSKVNPIIENNPILTQWTKDKDTIEQKKVGNSFIYYRGTATAKSEEKKSEGGAAIMLTSDWNMMDECDRSDQTALEMYDSRLDNSQFKGKCYFSNPTNPFTLSQKIYDQSDQKHWFVKCEHCQHWQYLDYFRNVKDGQYVCEKCAGVISDDARRNGQWVKRFRDRESSGYWISHLICPWISAKKIEEEYNTKSRAYFYNFVLGLPYIGSDVVVNRDLILKCVEDKHNELQNNVMGVDVGLTKHFVLQNSQGVFRVGKTETWDEIRKLIKVYDCSCCVIDAMPDQTEPRKIRDEFPGKVWLSYFKKDVRSGEFVKWDRDTHTVYSDRTKIIQQVIDDMVERKIRFQMDFRDLDEYCQHWSNMYKKIEKDTMGIERDIWESNGVDHFAFAQCYASLAMESASAGDSKIVKWGQRGQEDNNIAPMLSDLIKPST